MNFGDAALAVVEQNYLAVVVVEITSRKCQAFVSGGALAGLERASLYEEHLQIITDHLADEEETATFLREFELAGLIAALNAGKRFKGVLIRLRNADCTICYARIKASFLKSDPQKLLITYCDETEQFTHYFLDLHALHLNHAGLNFLAGHMCENILVANAQTGKSHLYTPCTDQICEKKDFTEQVNWFAEHSIVLEERDAYRNYFSMPSLLERLKANEGICTSNWTLSYPDGYHNYLIAACLISDTAAPDVEYVLAIAQDTTFLNTVQAQIHCDPVTGLFNQAYAKQEISCFLQTKQADLGLLLVMDIDHFKEINDCYGHLAGDNAITRLGNAISEIFSCQDIRCRWGGDEFLILINCFEDEKTLENIELLRCFMRQYQYNDISIPITLSIGAACSRQGMDFSVLFKQADKAMYTAKKQGRDSLQWSC